ncbi:phospho-sugar glycosidase domain-containing protein [Pediococcus pentosaceus]|nr:phospho-sugar glycosidase domain-containing protein [Pediococcus pentosaceus]
MSMPQYKAETQIALQDLENNGRVNVVGPCC